MAVLDVKARLARRFPLPRRHGGQTKVRQQRPPATWRAPASRRHGRRLKVRRHRPLITFGHQRRPTTFHRQQRPPSVRHHRQPPRTRHRLPTPKTWPPALENISPTPVTTKLSPSQKPAADYDGFTVGIDDVEGTGQRLPNRPRPARQSKLRQKPVRGIIGDTAAGRSSRS